MYEKLVVFTLPGGWHIQDIAKSLLISLNIFTIDKLYQNNKITVFDNFTTKSVLNPIPTSKKSYIKDLPWAESAQHK